MSLKKTCKNCYHNTAIGHRTICMLCLNIKGVSATYRKWEKGKSKGRPAKCRICKKQLYYVENPKYEPEYLISIEVEPKSHKAFHVHRRCWKTLYKMKDSVIAPKKKMSRKRAIKDTIRKK